MKHKYIFLTILLLGFTQLAHAGLYRLGFPGKPVAGKDFHYTDWDDLQTIASNGDTIQVYNALAFSGLGYTGTVASFSPASPTMFINKSFTFIGYGFNLDKNTGLQAVNKSAEKQLDMYFQTGSEGSKVIGMYCSAELYTGDIVFQNCQINDFRIVSDYDCNNVTVQACNFADPRFPTEVGGILIAPSGQGLGSINNLKIVNNYIGFINFGTQGYYEDPFDPLMSFEQQGSGVIANNIFAKQEASNAINVNVFGLFDCKNNIILDTNFDNACFFTGQFTPLSFGNNSSFHHNLYVGLTQSGCTNYTTGNQYNLLGTAIFQSYNGFITKDSNMLLTTTSTAINAGINNAAASTNCGIFGGELADKYILSGIPNVPAIYKLATATNMPLGTSTIYTISTRSNNAANINRLEYYIDTDPGMGLATAISITAATNISNATVTIPLTALSGGIHNLVVRSRDANGSWSLNNIVAFVKPQATVAAPALARINKIEYFVDTDPGIGLATNVVITNDTSKINQAIAVNTTGLSNGSHNVFVRSRDSVGRWSLTHFKPFNYTASTGTKPNLGADQTISKCVEQTVNLTTLAVLSGVTNQYFTSSFGAITNQAAVQNGVYQIIGTASVGGLMDTVQITVTNFPKPNLGLDTTVRVCIGFTYNLTTLFTNAALTYVYLNNSNAVITNQATAAVGVYNVIATNSNGCKDTIVVQVSTHPKPNLGINVTHLICAGNTANLPILVTAPSGSTLTYFNNTFAVLASTSVGQGVYNIIATNTLGCKDTLLYTVIANPKPSLGADQTITKASNATVNLTTLYTGNIFTYYNTTFSNTIANPSAVDTGMYQIVVTTTDGCKDTVKITVTNTATTGTKPNLGADQTVSKCVEQTVNLTTLAVLSGVTNQYFTSSFATITNQAAVQNGVYQIIGTASVGGLKDTVQITVTNFPKPNLGADQTVSKCVEAIYNLSALFTTAGVTFNYFTSSFGGGVNPTGVTIGVYQVIGINSNGCKDTVQVTVTNFPKPALGADQTITKASSAFANLATLYTGNTFTYFNNNFSATISNPSAVDTGMYQIIATNANGCKDTVKITVTNTTTTGTKPNLGADQTISKCVEQTVNLTTLAVLSGVTNQYFTSSFVAITNQASVQNGVYQIIGTANNGGLKDTVQVTVNNYLKPTLQDSFTYIGCNNPLNFVQPFKTVFNNLYGTSNLIFALKNIPSYSNTDTSLGLAFGTYLLIGYNSDGCADSSIFTYKQNVPNLGNDTTVYIPCGSTTYFDIGYAYNSNGTIGQFTNHYNNFANSNISGSNLIPGIYHVIGTCANLKDTIKITIVAATKPNLGADQTITKASSAFTNLTTLYTGNTFTYFNNNFSATISNPSAVDTGMYQIIATNTNGCKDTVKITVANSATTGTKPNLGADQTISKCVEQTVNLTSLAVVSGVTNLYYTASFAAMSNQTAVQNGVYQIIGTASVGGLKDTVQITVNNYPKPAMGIDYTTNICVGTTFNILQFYTDPNLTYTFLNSVFMPITNQVAVSAGVYYVIGTNTNGCTDTVIETINNYPQLNLGTDINVSKCIEVTYNLSALFTTPGLTYNYLTGSFGGGVNPAMVAAGVYQVIGINSTNCKDTIQVTVTNFPKPSLGADQTITKASSAFTNLTTLYIGNTFTYYNNNFSATISNPSAVDTGMYQIIATNTNGCKDTVKITVVNVTNAKPNLGADQTISKCVETTINLTTLAIVAGVTNAYYNASYVAITNQTAVQNGVYQIIGTATVGGLKDTVQVTVNNYPKPNLGANVTVNICGGGTTNLTTLVTTSGLTYTYYNANFATVISTPNAVSVGNYNVIATNATGCKDTLGVTVVASTFSLGADLIKTYIANNGYLLSNAFNLPGVTFTYFNSSWNTTSTTAFIGTYYIVGNNSGCKDTVKVTVKLGKPGSIIYVKDVIDTTTATVQYSVYPNPVTDILNIKLYQGSSYNIKVCLQNIHGSIVYHGSITDKETLDHQINMSTYASGIYLLKITDGNSINIIEKVIKQ